MGGGGGMAGLKGADLLGIAGSQTVVGQLLLAAGRRPQLLLLQRRNRADPFLVPDTLSSAASPDSEDKSVRAYEICSCTSKLI